MIFLLQPPLIGFFPLPCLITRGSQIVSKWKDSKGLGGIWMIQNQDLRSKISIKIFLTKLICIFILGIAGSIWAPYHKINISQWILLQKIFRILPGLYALYHQTLGVFAMKIHETCRGHRSRHVVGCPSVPDGPRKTVRSSRGKIRPWNDWNQDGIP